MDQPGSPCAAASQVYKGYVDDPRNTDNAWIETVAVSIHFPDQSNVELKRLNSVWAGLGSCVPRRGQCRARWEGPDGLLGQGQSWPGTLRWGPPGATACMGGGQFEHLYGILFPELSLIMHVPTSERGP